VKLRLAFPAFQMPAVTTGTGSVKSLAQLAGIENAVFLVSGQAGVWSYVDAALHKGGVAVPAERILARPAGEPSVDSIRHAATFLHARSAPLLVAVGGGSVLDWARLAWAHAAGRLDLSSGAVAENAGGPRPTTVLVPTTCASGAEGASVAVYSDAGRKRPAVSPLFLADRVVLDGRFLASLDEATLSASLSDALTHAVESLVSLVPNYLAKAMAGAALRSLLEHADGGIPAASRADRLLEASYLAGVAASHTSVGIAHAFAHAMAAEQMPHGRGNATAIVAALRFNAEAPAVQALLADTARSGHDLLARLRVITAPARYAGAAVTQTVLADPARRASLKTAMLADTALRTNPIRTEEADLDRFLALVGEEAARP
jgi:alcohol dehydrogenase class IV